MRRASLALLGLAVATACILVLAFLGLSPGTGIGPEDVTGIGPEETELLLTAQAESTTDEPDSGEVREQENAPTTLPDVLPATGGGFARASVASWYGPGLFGNLTASGDVCCAGYTTAHRELPFGTQATLANPDDGRTVEVVVNDRGPHVAGREWDLSPAAADAIGVSAAGVMQVEVLAVT